MCMVVTARHLEKCTFWISYNKTFLNIQGISGRIVNILGGGSMDYSEWINSYKHVSKFEWMWRYSCLKLVRTDLTPLDICLWGWIKSEVYKEKVNTRDELVARVMNSAALVKQERQDDLRGATRILPRELKCALKSMVGFLNTYFDCFNLLWSFT